jgi:hypothetical protein
MEEHDGLLQIAVSARAASVENVSAALADGASVWGVSTHSIIGDMGYLTLLSK